MVRSRHRERTFAVMGTPGHPRA
ncbi:hypothetical protein STAN_0351 [Streptomyces sp. CBMAI 2042]|nr:hypothetical protein STAN_0351 [Streptomyces sp. CBMAI 2042]